MLILEKEENWLQFDKRGCCRLKNITINNRRVVISVSCNSYEIFNFIMKRVRARINVYDMIYESKKCSHFLAEKERAASGWLEKRNF